MDSKELLALAERATNAKGADREIDAQVGRYFASKFLGYVPDEPQTGCAKFTASLDDAMGLVPEGWHVGQLQFDWTLSKWAAGLVVTPSEGQRAIYANGGTIMLDDARSDAATPALALTAASLRALATQEK